ncbi:MAG: CoA transferase [Lachnospiraceae bacterium]|nr:CoA transferase [Lachnospiraceae bacterium]
MAENILEGVKVLDMCVAAAGPSCSRMLVDFGAEDIMVEPLEGQSTRYTAPHSFDFKCGGKKGIPCNLKTPEGKELLTKLVKWADVMVCNYREKAMVKLGFSYEELHKINPRLIYAHLYGFGNKGPKKDDPGFDATAWWGRSGLLVDIAQPDSIINIPYATGDFSAGHSLALGICAALYRREKTGEGMKVSTSLMASGIFLNYDAIVETQYGYKLPTSRKRAIRAMLNSYQCGDGEWISINATHHWETSWPCICRTIHREDLIDKYPEHDDTKGEFAPAVIAILDEEFKKYDSDYIVESLLSCGTIAVEKAQHSIDVTKDEQAIENEYVYEWTDREGKKIMHPATPIRFNDGGHQELKYAPMLGEHTIEVMHMLGYTDDQIKDYEDRGIVKAIHGHQEYRYSN